MDDTISRQAATQTALEFIVEYLGGAFDEDLQKKLMERMNTLPFAQPECIQNNAVHLCDSCQFTYVTCPSHGNDAFFGDGKGNDNICACNKYRPISAQPEERALHESCKDCPLYDHDRHSCPRFNKVIPETLREVMAERRQDDNH